jgi:hypothetical protein
MFSDRVQFISLLVNMEGGQDEFEYLDCHSGLQHQQPGGFMASGISVIV